MKITKDLTLPPDAVCRTMAILAQKGSGKTYSAMKLAEEMASAGRPFVFLDPTGVAWGLRSDATGDGPGCDVIIMGGAHGDVPLESTAGAVVAQFIVESGRSLVLDLSLFESKAAQNTFTAALAERLYRLKARPEHRTPLHLILDEADQFVPQRPYRGEERMLGAFETIVRLGRSRGLGITLVSQRAAVVNKNVLTQVDALMCLRTTGKQDLDAVIAWVRHYLTAKGQLEEFTKTLPSLAVGEMWFWSPGWLGSFSRGQVLPRRTYDSSSTPEPGAALKQIVLAPVDLDALSAQIRATVERAKADDPKELKKQIAELQRQLSQKPAPPPVPEKEIIGVPCVRQIDLTALDGVRLEIERLFKGMHDRLTEKDIAYDAQPGQGQTIKIPIVPFHELRARRASAAPARSASAPPINQEANGSNGNAQRILNTIAMLLNRDITPTRECVARWLAIHPNGGRYGSTLAALRSERKLDGMMLTELGLAIAEPGPSGQQAALDALPDDAKRTLLQEIITAGEPLTRDTLACRLGIHPNGGRYGSNLSWLRTMGLIPERGAITALPCVFR